MTKPKAVKKETHYGLVRSAKELGQLVRAHRKNRQLTLETVSGLSNLSPRFLSEFERGKETAEIGKVLKALRTLGLEVIIQPRGGRLGNAAASTFKDGEGQTND
ncbi:MAG: transcriptional regulator [Moraxellaceae bacterium]|nr:MAG: transcriptional regulator [Moraxellaceae bacterium]